MISPNRKEGNDQSVSEYRNIVATQQDHALDKSSVYRQSENMQILAKNFHILEQFLQGFKNYQFQKQLVQLASTSNFKEQWQNKRKEMHQLKYSYFFRQNFWYLSISIFLFILQIVLIWFLSVFRVFGLQQNRSLFIFCFTIQVLDMALKSSYLLFYKLEKQKSTFFQIKLRDWVDIYLGNFYCTVYALLGISQIISSIQTQQLLLLDLVAIGFSYCRIEDIQKDIKMIKSNLQFKNYIKLFHLMSTLIMIIHIFAVLMYFATNFSQNHYLDDVKIQQGRSWLNLYIYSFYFSGTTVLTVGYGDILPKNIIEIFIVLLMQIFGVVMIVYLNGEVGNILCSLRRQKENLQNDLSVLQRLKASFKLSLETTQKIRQFLIDNRRADQENMVHQQKALLAKISSGLRQQATLTNHINIIRQSLFLLSNFTIKAHLCISNKLVHSIYSPNQIIFQIRGQEKLFFVKKGEICFYISKKDSENENERKIIKTLSISNQDKENSNCFGYVSLIMGRPNRLKSFAKDFSSCYSIQKDQFIQAISCDNKDFEKYHEMRQNYMTERQPQKNEAEMFFNDREHYVCQVSKVIEEYLKQHHHSRRRNKLRQYKRRKLIYEINGGDSNVSESQSQIDSFPSEIKITETEKSVITNNQNSCLTIKERKKKYQQFNNEEIKNSATNLVVQRKYAKRYCKNAYTKKRGQQLKEFGKRFQQVKLKYSEPFQVGSSFSYFYTQFNIDMVMRKVNYYSKVLSIFTNMFQQTLDRVNANKGLNEPNGDFIPGSTLNIEKYRRQKDFLETINIKL